MDLTSLRKMVRCLVTMLFLLLLWFPVTMTTRPIDGQVFTGVLKDLARDSLGVDGIQDYLYNDVEYRNALQTPGEEILKQITSSMDDLFVRLTDAVFLIRDAVESVLNDDDTFTANDDTSDQYEPCSSVTELTTDPGFPNLTVNMNKMCVVGPGIKNEETRYPAKDTILQAVKKNTKSIPELKWQYIALEQNYVINYPATRINWPNYQPRQRSWYKESASPTRKDIVLVFDKSRAMQRYLIHNGEMSAVLHTVIDTLSPNDRIGIVAFDGEAVTPGDCYTERLALSIPVNIRAMEDFVNSIPLSTGGTSGESSYSKAFHTAFQYFINSYHKDDGRDKVILFLSDGRPTDNEAEILNTISAENAKLGNQVVIQTFGIGQYATEDSSVRLMTSIAHQDRANTSAGKIAPGEYHPVSNAEELRQIMAATYWRPAGLWNHGMVLSGPYHDGFGFGIMYSACLPIHRGGTSFVGVTCIDILMRDLVEDLTSYPCFQHSSVAYSFMINRDERYVYHPLLPLSVDKDDEPVYADFFTLERGEAVDRVLDGMVKAMLGGEQNSTVLTSQHVTPRGTTQGDGIDHTQMKLRYYWGPIGLIGFSVCVVLDESDTYTDFMAPARYPDRVLYHRPDLVQNPPPTCNSQNRIAFRDDATVVLTVNAFRTPGRYYNLERINAQNVSDIEDYLQGGTQNIMHIKEDVRSTVAVLYEKLEEIWRNRTGSLESTGLRYVGTREGVFIHIPGVRYPHPYDHTKRSWYIHAIHSQHGFAVVGPYRDASSGLMTVTLARTLLLPGNQTLGVAAVDLALNQLYDRFVQVYRQCESESGEYICTIMDDRGMVVLDMEYIYSPENIPSETSVERHIVMKEPGIAKDLKRRGVMTKHECFNSKSIKYMNFYKVKIPDVLNGTLDGEFYTMLEVPGTNIFLLLKKSSYTDYDDEACHCLPSGMCYSIIDDCPCPCHSHADYDYCEHRLYDDQNVPLPCYPDAPLYQFEDLAELERHEVQTLPLCYQYACQTLDNKLSCEAMFSCSWCGNSSCVQQLDCQTQTTQDVGMKTNLTVPAPNVPDETPTSVIIGGAAAGAVVAIVVVVIAVVLYRKRKSSSKSDSSGETYMYSPSTDSVYTEPDYMDSDDISSLKLDASPTAPPGGVHLGFINKGFEYKERPLPATPTLPRPSFHGHMSTPPIPNPSPLLYKLIRDSSIYNNPPPSPIPDYLDPESIPPPEACPGVNSSSVNDHNEAKFGTRRPLVQIQQSDDNPDGIPAPHALPSYNNFKPEPELGRPVSTVSSSIGYGTLPMFQNQDVLDEVVQTDDSESNSPTYINAEAEVGLHYGPISPDTLDGDFGQVPVFENADVLDTIGADNPNHSQTDETKPNDEIYVNAKPNPTSKINVHKHQDFFNANNDVASSDDANAVPSVLDKRDSDEPRIKYVNSPSEQQDTRPISTVSTEPDYGTVPVFENEDSDDISSLKLDASPTAPPGGVHLGFINKGFEYKERPLPATPTLPRPSFHGHMSTPPIPNPSPLLYKLIRDSSIYNNPPPSPIPDYLDPESIPPPEACPGVNSSSVNDHNEAKFGTRRPLVQIQQSDDNPDGIPAPHALPSYNNFKPEPELGRPVSTVSSSIGYGTLPMFQNQDVLDEVVQTDDSESNSPTYINAEAEVGLHYGPISPDTLDGDFGQVPVFENADVLDTIGADNPNHSQTDETKPNDEIYVNAKPNPTSKINVHKHQDFFNANNDVASSDDANAVPSVLDKRDSDEPRIKYVNSPSEQQDTRPISTVSTEPDYGTVPVFENEVFL